MNTDTMDAHTPTTKWVEDGYAHDPEAAYRNPVGYGSEVAANRRAFRRWQAAHDAEVRAEAWGIPINAVTQNDAAFTLYKHDHPESIAKSWETVGLPIVLEYRTKANVVLDAYFTAIRSQTTETDETK